MVDSSSLNNTTYPSRPKLNRDNKRILIQDSIESSAKLIRQLIAVKVSSHSELSSIKKSNDDIKKVTAYTKTCQESLMKEWIHYVNLHLVNLRLVILHFVNFTFGQLLHWVNCYQTSTDTFHHTTFFIFPFLKNPNTYLAEKHQGPSNFRQARRIYMTQYKKNELVKHGFMVKLLDMPIDCQKLVQEAPFNHYYPWFIVSKNDSISTPRRIVVDPSCTGLNQILPKGENRIGTIPDIIMRNRTKPVGWAKCTTNSDSINLPIPSHYFFIMSPSTKMLNLMFMRWSEHGME